MRQENLSSSQHFFEGRGGKKNEKVQRNENVLFLDYMVADTENPNQSTEKLWLTSLASFLETKLMYTFLDIFILQNKVRKYKVAEVTIFINIKNIKFLDVNLMKDM